MYRCEMYFWVGEPVDLNGPSQPMLPVRHTLDAIMADVAAYARIAGKPPTPAFNLGVIVRYYSWRVTRAEVEQRVRDVYGPEATVRRSTVGDTVIYCDWDTAIVSIPANAVADVQAELISFPTLGTIIEAAEITDSYKAGTMTANEMRQMSGLPPPEVTITKVKSNPKPAETPQTFVMGEPEFFIPKAMMGAMCGPDEPKAMRFVGTIPAGLSDEEAKEAIRKLNLPADESKKINFREFL